MCGIAGLVGQADPGALAAMLAAIEHRGPDAQGSFSPNPSTHLGVRRLAIVDPIHGHQPLFNETGTIALACNGEIYNADELRRQLIGRGHRFQSDCDVEVIVHLYEESGIRCVEQLRGMFAFALADGPNVYLVRDHVGIKPLFYHLSDDCTWLCFGSEIKAILSYPQVPSEVDETSLADTWLVGYPLGDRTLFQGIRSVRPGHWLAICQRDGRLEVVSRAFYKVPSAVDETLSLPDAIGLIKESLIDAVLCHLPRNMRVALPLSGGLDSGLLANLITGVTDTVDAYTVSTERDSIDTLISRGTCEPLGLSHQEVVVEWEEYVDAIAEAVWIEEQPSQLFALPVYFLARAMCGTHKVGMCGEGADELFGGYFERDNWRDYVRNLQERMRLIVGSGLTPGADAVGFVTELLRIRTWHEFQTRMFDWLLGDQLVQGHLEPFDKYCMAFAIEMRVPFLDVKFLEAARRVPYRFRIAPELDINKYVLRHIAVSLTPSLHPDSILRSKRGFPSAAMAWHRRFCRCCESSRELMHRVASGSSTVFVGVQEFVAFEMFVEIMLKGRGVRPKPGFAKSFLSAWDVHV
jgi:asparagine synthase (glutamine-hydrolysing)